MDELANQGFLDIDYDSQNYNGLNVYAHYTDSNIKDIFKPLLKRLTKLQKEKSKRILVILAAPPGAGKTTICTYLEKLSKENEEFTNIQCIGMDGFHYYQDYLNNHTTIRNGKKISIGEIFIYIHLELPILIITKIISFLKEPI